VQLKIICATHKVDEKSTLTDDHAWNDVFGGGTNTEDFAFAVSDLSYTTRPFVIWRRTECLPGNAVYVNADRRDE